MQERFIDPFQNEDLEEIMIYEYHCHNCKKDFEIEKRIDEPKEQKCPFCDSFSTQRLVSRSTFVLKGKGWYKDGY